VDKRSNETGTENTFATYLTGKYSTLLKEALCESAPKRKLYAAYTEYTL
jgi:hypothetical protein